MAKSKKKAYRVNIDMVWSQDYAIIADSAKDAKAIAVARFKKRLPIKKNFRVTTERS